MSRFFKTVVLYLSMLTVPIQGYAASTMLFCGTAHHRSTASQGTERHSSHSHANDSAGEHQHVHPAAVFADSSGNAPGGEAVDMGGNHLSLATNADLGAHESSDYADCCVMAAVPVSSMGFQPAERAIERFVSAKFPNIGFVTDGPIRPPRSFPA